MPYLMTRNGGTYWFQIRVPKMLVPTYGALIRQNLQTKNITLAQPMAYRLASFWMERFAAERSGRDENPQAGPLVIMQAPLSPTLPGFQQAVMSPSPEAAESPQPEPQPKPQRSRRRTGKSRHPGKSLMDIFLYWSKLNPHCVPSTSSEMQSVAREFDEQVKKAPRDLVRIDITRFRDHLLGRDLARATVAKRMSIIGSLLQTAYDGGLISHNVARGVRIPRSKVEVMRRRPFSSQELQQIFSSPVYGQNRRYAAGSGEASAWVPMLALVTGARLEEICQLRLADITRDENHGPVMRITDEGEGQRVKTMSSRRHIPLHPDLIRAGFLDYIELVEDNGHDWLFPELEPDHDGRRGGNFSKWFARYLRSPKGCNIHDQRVVFHSFRHTFKTLCRESGIPEEVHDALTGHNSAAVGRSYGHVPLKALVEAIANLELPVKLPRIPVGGA